MRFLLCLWVFVGATFGCALCAMQTPTVHAKVGFISAAQATARTITPANHATTNEISLDGKITVTAPTAPTNEISLDGKSVAITTAKLTSKNPQTSAINPATNEILPTSKNPQTSAINPTTNEILPTSKIPQTSASKAQHPTKANPHDKRNLSADHSIVAIDFEWVFSPNFTDLTILSYDINNNKSLDNDELAAVKRAFLDYLVDRGFLTAIKFYYSDDKDEQSYKARFSVHDVRVSVADGSLRLSYTAALDSPIAVNDSLVVYVRLNDPEDYFRFGVVAPSHSDFGGFFISANTNLDTSFYSFTTAQPATKLLSTIAPVPQDSAPSAIDRLNLGIFEVLKSSFSLDNGIFGVGFLAFISFVYGLFHALGPGHGKLLTSSYFLSQDKSYLKAFYFASGVGFSHILGSFALTSATLWLASAVAPARASYYTLKLSAALICVISAALVWRKISHKPTCACSSCNNHTAHSCEHSCDCGCNSDFFSDSEHSCGSGCNSEKSYGCECNSEFFGDSEHSCGCGCNSAATATTNEISFDDKFGAITKTTTNEISFDDKSVAITAAKPTSEIHTTSEILQTSASNRNKRNFTTAMVALAAGVVPCPATVLVFLLAWSLGRFWLAFLSALCISAGMSVVIFASAVLAVRARSSITSAKIRTACEYAGLCVMFLLGVWMMIFVDFRIV